MESSFFDISTLCHTQTCYSACQWYCILQEKKIRGRRERCEATPECEGKSGLDFTSCVRTCMSPSCYEILYKHDEVKIQFNPCTSYILWFKTLNLDFGLL